MTEFEELKRRVEELERKSVGACPGPCRCPYRNQPVAGDNMHIYPCVITSW